MVQSPDRSWGLELVALRNFRQGDLIAVYAGDLKICSESSGAYSIMVCARCGLMFYYEILIHTGHTIEEPEHSGGAMYGQDPC